VEIVGQNWKDWPCIGCAGRERRERRRDPVSSTVKDLVVGPGLRFTDRGTHQLKGVPGEWHLFAVEG